MANPSQTPYESPEARPPAPPAPSAAPQVQVTVTQAPPPNQPAKPGQESQSQSPPAAPSQTLTTASPPPKDASPEPPPSPAGEGSKPAATPPKPDAPKAPFTERIPEHVAAMLAYLFGWISGLVLLLVDRRPFVRYHAAQAVVVFATLSLLMLVLGDFFLGALLPHFGGALLVLRRVVELTWLVAVVVLMLKAGSGERYRVPYAASYADRAAGAK